MKNFARVMGLLFGSAGAHTYPKSVQIAPPPSGRVPMDQLYHTLLSTDEAVKATERYAQGRACLYFSGHLIPLLTNIS